MGLSQVIGGPVVADEDNDSGPEADEWPRIGTGPDDLSQPLRELVTFRLVGTFTMLRRAEILANRRLFDLTEIEWQIIIYVGGRGPFSLSRLAELTMKDEGQLSRAVKKMCTRGLLSRRRIPGGPSIEIGLSDEGRALFRTMAERSLARDRWMTEGLAEEDVDALGRVVDTMMERARAMLEEQKKLAG
jgi:DNA-binding MarR family transcriptional regulator